jgi:hypothetical protein
MVAAGDDAVPSPTVPDPGGAPFFTGQYSTERHGSRDGGTVSAVQVELHTVGVRDTGNNRRAFAERFAQTLRAFLTRWYGL